MTTKRPWRVQYLRPGETVWRTVAGYYYETEAGAKKAIRDGWLQGWISRAAEYRPRHIDDIKVEAA